MISKILWDKHISKEQNLNKKRNIYLKVMIKIESIFFNYYNILCLIN